MATSNEIILAPRGNARDRAPHFDKNARKLNTASWAIEAALAIADDIGGASPRRGPGADPNPRTRETRHALFRRFSEEFKTGVKPETGRNAWFDGWNVGHRDRLRGSEKGAAR